MKVDGATRSSFIVAGGGIGGDIYHASGVPRELRNRLFQSGQESAGCAGLKWLYDGIAPTHLPGPAEFGG
jgi:hypothetical protein